MKDMTLMRMFAAPALVMILTFGISACDSSSADDLTPAQVVDTWSKSSETARILSENFREENLELAKEWIVRKRSGAPQDELDSLVLEGASAIVSRNSYLVARAPDAELLQYTNSARYSYDEIMKQRPELCDTSVNKSDKDYKFLASLPLETATVSAMATGKKQNFEREIATDSEFSAYVRSARKRLTQSELRSLDSPTSSTPPALRCKIAIAGFDVLASMAPQSRGRIIAALLGRQKGAS